MKARIPPMSANQRRRAMAEIKILTQKELENGKHIMSRRFFKISAVVLHNEFKFGAGRIDKFFNELQELMYTAQDDEIFWEHVDQLVIDRLGFDFERDYTR